MDTEKAAVETGVIKEKDGFTPDEVSNFGFTDLNEITTLKDDGDFHIKGLPSQLQEMFADWAKYIGEVQNPYTNAENAYLKNQYAPLDEVLNKTRPVLSKYGFGISQIPRAETGKVSVQTFITHKSGAYMMFPSFGVPIVKNDAQTIIAGITYARRGSSNSILATHGEKDEDGNGLGADGKSKKPETPKSTIPVEISEKQKAIRDLSNELVKNKFLTQDAVYSTLEAKCGSKNPNSVTDITILNATYDALDKIRTDKKAGK